MNSVRKKILKARTGLLLEHPFFGSLCLRMEPQEDHRCATAWTDGRTLAYNPRYVANLKDRQVQGLMAHTIMHPACQHHVRRMGRDPATWNMACDYAINWILLDAGLDLPPKYLDNPAYHGKSADEIYVALCGDHGGEERPSISKEQGEADGEIDADEMDAQAGEGEDPGDTSESDDGEVGGDGLVEEGSAGDDPGDEGGDQTGDPGGSGEVRDSEEAGLGGATDDASSDEQWELALAQAAQQARDIGELPGGLERLVNDVLNPKLDWRELLSRYISDRARDDYSWAPPNKRFLHMDIILPSLSHQKLPEVVLALDTSGSVTAQEMEQFAAEVSGVLDAFDTTIHVVYCDSRVSGSDSFGRADLPLSLNPEGGGGTDYRPVFRWVDEQGIDPACLVYLTDMECVHFPEHEPEYPVLWAQVGEGGKVPPFGDIMEIC
ncbi:MULTISPECIES: VWA-like domain-containing protein [unclassified Pseudodesulfovibrio]|uniref:vWA domain-containing protein n=1 Tax=unclassified Pseudodesulfovibrio TaxID=2661612 RepID=UPI000FEB6826|nr:MULTISPECIES: VWA-like domain-containing protein [unclassified Pseudodesulfovibrio]MCJ2163371.1 VWA-like domain-containing protein [Pseudodesulfovibrio sp. S3-i]RWU06610.1 hypothetical protein DWB63_02280 [Pseudodesulfovibrio sp. S3]